MSPEVFVNICTAVELNLLCGHMIPRAMLAVAYATGRALYDRQVKGDYPNKKEYPGPPVWCLGVWLTNPPNKKGYTP
jgi:hypothetical protein